jgi:hypothetical protein
MTTHNGPAYVPEGYVRAVKLQDLIDFNGAQHYKIERDFNGKISSVLLFGCGALPTEAPHIRVPIMPWVYLDQTEAIAKLLEDS